MWDGETFRFGIEWRGPWAQNPRLLAVRYPPFAKCAKDGAPTLWLCQEIQKPGPPALCMGTLFQNGIECGTRSCPLKPTPGLNGPPPTSDPRHIIVARDRSIVVAKSAV